MSGVVCDKHGIQEQRPCPACELEKKDDRIFELQAELAEEQADFEKFRDERNKKIKWKQVCIDDYRDQVEKLKAELAKHQESEFHPDWSMLEATRDSLREHAEEIKRLRGGLGRIAEGVWCPEDGWRVDGMQPDEMAKEILGETP